MKILSFRELRNTPGAFWRKLRRERTLAVTANGVPKAVVIDVAGGDLEEALMIAERVQAQLALSRIRAKSREVGTDRLSPAEIEAEISAARRARR